MCASELVENLQEEGPDKAIVLLAEQQYGVLSRAQVLDAGLTRQQLYRRVKQGLWEKVHPGVYRVPGSDPSDRQKLLIACFSGGSLAVASHAAAAWLWGLPGGAPAPQITVPRGKQLEVPGATVHTTTSLQACDRMMRCNIPVTGPARLVVDMAAVLPRHDLEILLDAVLSRDLARRQRIAWRVAGLAASGRVGLGALREMLAARSTEGGVPASVLESKARLVLQGLPAHHWNRRVVADKERFLDLDFDRVPLSGEFDGWDYHSGRVQHQDDLRRQNAILSQGRTLLRYTHLDLTENPQGVRAAFIGNGRRLARATKDPAVIAAWEAVNPAVPAAHFITAPKARPRLDP